MIRPACLLLALGAVSTSLAAPPVETVADIVCRGTSGEGFSYEWGGECWCRSGCAPNLTDCAPGVCTPDAGSTGCPDCTHTGTYGADCSGFVSKAWQVPSPYATEACDVARYRAVDFTSDHAYWNVVPMTSLRPADAVASTTHVILIIGERTAHGEHEVVEAKGCVYGIVRQVRGFSSSYSGARRVDLTDCECAAGAEETRSCGDCGTQGRTCVGGCTWSAWSSCEGPDPGGPDADCSAQGELGACAEGRRLCVAGWTTCEPSAPTTERCDGVDNDCDGVTDNGSKESLGEGEPCTGEEGSEGLTECVAGSIVCATSEVEPPDPGDPEEGPVQAFHVFGRAPGCDCGSAGGGGLLGLSLVLLLVASRCRRRGVDPMSRSPA